nr:hypothetical protein [Tanacetum cinerariifolium]
SISSTQGKVSSIPTILSWIDSISFDGFFPFILPVVVFMVTVIIVAVVLEIVVVVIVRVVIVVANGWAYAFHHDKASLVRVPVANVTLCSSADLLRKNTYPFPLFATGVFFDPRFLLGLSVFAMVAASASRAAAIPSEINYNVVEEEDGGWICFLGGNNSSGTKKYQGSNSSDGDNTGDGVKLTGGVIGSGDGIGAEVEPLEHGFEFDDHEWVEMGSFLFVRLEMRYRGFKDSILRLITSIGYS